MPKSRPSVTVLLAVALPARSIGQDVVPVATAVNRTELLAWDPQNVPGAGWPGITPQASNAAWPSGMQLPSLAAWPMRDKNPLPCWKVEVLRDSQSGWPGFCRDLTPVALTPPSEAACEESCRSNSLCGVFQYMSDGSCLQGPGKECDGPGPVVPGQPTIVRLLRNMRGWEVLGLRPLGNFPANLSDGANRCRAFCYSNLKCQYWQYAPEGGCYVEDPVVNQGMISQVAQEAEQELGLTSKTTFTAQYPLTTPIGATQASPFAQSSIAGEYIQHLCPAHPSPVAPVAVTDANPVTNAEPWYRSKVLEYAIAGLVALCCLAVLARGFCLSRSRPKKSRSISMNSDEEDLPLQIDIQKAAPVAGNGTGDLQRAGTGSAVSLASGGSHAMRLPGAPQELPLGAYSPAQGAPDAWGYRPVVSTSAQPAPTLTPVSTSSGAIPAASFTIPNGRGLPTTAALPTTPSYPSAVATPRLGISCVSGTPEVGHHFSKEI